MVAARCTRYKFWSIFGAVISSAYIFLRRVGMARNVQGQSFLMLLEEGDKHGLLYSNAVGAAITPITTTTRTNKNINGQKVMVPEAS